MEGVVAVVVAGVIAIWVRRVLASGTDKPAPGSKRVRFLLHSKRGGSVLSSESDDE